MSAGSSERSDVSLTGIFEDYYFEHVCRVYSLVACKGCASKALPSAGTIPVLEYRSIETAGL